MIYTGVGARFAPGDVLRLFEKTAEYLAKQGHMLRSGGAVGCDSAFERGCDKLKGEKEIFYPADATKRAFEIVQTVITDPHWQHMKYCVRRLHARNVLQVIGRGFNAPSDFLICWTEGGKEVGGTATAMKLARMYNVPIINAAHYRGPKWVDFVKRVKELAGG